MRYKMHWVETLKATVLFWRLPKHLLERSQTHIEVVGGKVLGQSGVISIKTLESEVKDVNGVEIQKNLFGRLLNYGNIKITTPSTTHIFKNIGKPDELKAEIQKERAIYEN